MIDPVRTRLTDLDDIAGGKVAIPQGGTGAGTAANARTALGLSIGTDVPSQASQDTLSAAMGSHVVNTANPHGTTAGQVGAYSTAQVDTLLNGKASTSHNHNLSSLSDVTISGLSSGQLLKWNGSAWVNSSDLTGGGGASVPSTTTLLKGDGSGGIISATAGTDYLTPSGAAAGYQPLDGDLTAIAAISANGWLKRTGANTWTTASLLASDIPDISATYLTISAAAATYLTTTTAAAGYQPLDGDLTALAALAGTGFAKRTGANAWTVGALTSGDIPDISATYLTTSAAATTYQAQDADLTAVAALSTTGVVKRTGSNTWTAGALSSGDIPDISATYLTVTTAAAGYQPLDGDLTALAALAGTGYAKRTGANTWTVAAIPASDLPTTGLTVNQHISTIASPTDGSTVTFDLATSDWFTVQIGGNRTLALSNPAVNQQFTIVIQQDATGTRTVTWFSGILWSGGSAPTLTTTANKRDVFTFKCISSGVYLGFVAGLNH